jgi:tripeptidyl-peptidase-1
METDPFVVGAKAITPDVIRARYNVTSGLINSNGQNTNAVAEFQHQNYDPSDLALFFSKFVTVGQEFNNITTVIGENKPRDPQLEASLDTQFIMGVAPNASTWFIIVAPNAFWADLVNWVAILSNTSDIPLVHSISYGSQGDYPAESYRARLDVEFQKLGLRGLSIIIASGDSGAGCLYEGGGGPGLDLPPCYFAASYPAVSAYITSVGATEFIDGNTGPEAAVAQFKSGGGWDITFPRPSYQDSAVRTYLNTAPNLPAYGYNSSNRATPDVSALGSEYFQVINGGGLTPVGGTSASTPTFSAIVTLLNQIRLDRGDQPLGFLNQWIYQTWAKHSDAFFDVVVGNNIVPCCQGETSGFTTAAGWDPITGVGTPNFAVLSTIV